MSKRSNEIDHYLDTTSNYDNCRLQDAGIREILMATKDKTLRVRTKPASAETTRDRYEQLRDVCCLVPNQRTKLDS